MLQVLYTHDFITWLLNAIEKDSQSFLWIHAFNMSDYLASVFYYDILKNAQHKSEGQ